MDRPESRDPKPFLAKVRPEIGAGGFARDDGRIQFYSRVNALLEPDMTVVDLGAGRGSMFGSKGYAATLTKLQGKVARVVGIDVDDAITEHPYLDERHVVRVSDPWPVATASVDVIVADWVLEHVSAPETLATEAHRVLAPGGWLCARTPNKWGYVGIGARLVPNSLHVKLLRKIWPERTDIDVFPTEYRMNSLAAIRRIFPADLWNDHSYAAAVSPRYHGNTRILFRLVDFYQRLMPEGLSTDLMIFLQKKGAA